MKLKNIFSNITISFISLSISIALCELILSYLNPNHESIERSLLFSSPTFKLYSSGSVRYYPHQHIREIAVYDNKIVYDVKFKTNNLGLIDTKDYNKESIKGKSYYAFVGDSFTAGIHGGEPWVPKLRERINNQGIELYNLGVEGTSFEHFYRLLIDLKRHIDITSIVIVAISDDFNRPCWYPVIDKEEIFFYFCGYIDLAVGRIVPIDISNDEILRISKEIVNNKNQPPVNGQANVSSRLFRLLGKSQLFQYGKKALGTFSANSDNSINIDNALTNLKAIKAEFPSAEMHLIHLPAKNEVENKRYMTSNIAAEIEPLGIRYYPALEKCTWESTMFYDQDGHPNATGYENVSKCVSQYLFGTH